ncbi:MAG: replication initiation negative regulator SeqA [Alteromonadaceae bacterium]|nr:replication initiation negative regulator SeqA [Alteromonadaceae bacterium]
MKNIEIDEELYQYIVSRTQSIGESASSILRRLLFLKDEKNVKEDGIEINHNVVNEPQVKPISKSKNESVFNFINKEELAMQRGAVGRFLLILAALYRVHKQSFSAVNNISGRYRLYFANSAEELSESGSSTKPRQIPNSPFWVITNSNTTRKKMMLTKVAVAMGYNEKDVETIRELL